MTDPTVSVVIPTYERADRVGGAIESALAQTHEPMEVVVVDDASTDATPERLDSYADDDRVTVLRNETNRGISATRNRGIEAASGAFVCALDDDDRWDERKVEHQLRAFERLDDDYCCVYTGGVVRDRDGEVVREDEPGAVGDIWPEVLVRFEILPHSGHMVRRECLVAVGGYDPDFRVGVDWDLTVRLARRWKFAAVPEPLVERRYDDDNVSGDPAFGDPAYEVEIREALREKYADAFERHPEVAREFDAMLAKQRGLAALESGDRSTAVASLLGCLRRVPSVEHAAMTALAAGGRRAYRSAWRLKQEVA